MKFPEPGRPRVFVLGAYAVSVSLTHGAPHSAQQPFCEVPALMHRSASSVGNVAKWASGNGSVAIVQTSRALREPPTSFHCRSLPRGVPSAFRYDRRASLLNPLPDG